MTKDKSKVTFGTIGSILFADQATSPILSLYKRKVLEKIIIRFPEVKQDPKYLPTAEQLKPAVKSVIQEVLTGLGMLRDIKVGDTKAVEFSSKVIKHLAEYRLNRDLQDFLGEDSKVKVADVKQVTDTEIDARFSEANGIFGYFDEKDSKAKEVFRKFYKQCQFHTTVLEGGNVIQGAAYKLMAMFTPANYSH